MNRLHNEQGSALLIVLALLAIFGVLAISSVDRTQTEVEMSYNQLHEEQAFYIAEAGVKQAFEQLNDDNSWRTGYTKEPFGKGWYSVRLIDSSADSALYDSVLIRAEGNVDGSVSYVEVTTVPEYLRPFTYGLFADAGIALDQTTCTDSYNSDSGSYAATMLDSMGDIGSNGTVTSAKDVTFGGSISVATPGGISLGVHNTFTGDTTSTADSMSLDLFTQAEYDYAKDNSSAPGGMSGSGYAYDPSTYNLTAGSYSNIELTSGIYYFNDITLGQYSTLSLAPGAQVRIYVTGNITLNQGSTVNALGVPSDLLICSQGDSLTFMQSNTFVGAFWGPDAHIQYDQTTQAYGSLVGNTIKLDKGACFHFDRDLYEKFKRMTGNYFSIAWREVL